MPKAARRLRSQLSAATAYANDAADDEEEEEEEGKQQQRPQAETGRITKEMDGMKSAGRSRKKSCPARLLSSLPAASTFALGVLLAGVTLQTVGLLLLRTELTRYLADRQSDSSITFDTVFPSQYICCIVSAAFLAAFGCAHYAANAATHAAERRGGGGAVERVAVAMLLTFDFVLLCFWSLVVVATSLIVYAHAIYTWRLRRSLIDFDLNYFVPTWPKLPSLTVRHSSGGVPDAEVTIFTTFFPSLMMLIGVCTTFIGLNLLTMFLVVNGSRLFVKYPMPHRHRKTCDTQL